MVIRYITRATLALSLLTFSTAGFAQEIETPESAATPAITASATPTSEAPTQSARAEVQVEVEEPTAAVPAAESQAPVQQNIRVQVPSSSSAQVVETTTEVREKENTRVVERHLPSEGSANPLAYIVIGGGIAALAVAGLSMVSGRRVPT